MEDAGAYGSYGWTSNHFADVITKVANSPGPVWGSNRWPPAQQSMICFANWANISTDLVRFINYPIQNFLSSNGFVHRDLAARNVLLGENKVVKISDFGLMRQTNETVYHLKKGKEIPVKWMAPEVLYNSEYTTQSDV